MDKELGGITWTIGGRDCSWQEARVHFKDRVVKVVVHGPRSVDLIDQTKIHARTTFWAVGWGVLIGLAAAPFLMMALLKLTGGS
jgi:hypothetical protein